MAIEFDGSGTITIPEWVPTTADWDIVLDAVLSKESTAATYNAVLGGNETNGTDYLWIENDGAEEFRLRSNGGYNYFGYDLAAREVRTLYEFKTRDPDSDLTFTTSLYLDESTTAESTQTLSGPENYSVNEIGGATGSNGADPGQIYYRLQLIDNADPSNTRDYRFDDGSGTTLTDYGPGEQHGTLVDFVDAEAAWVSDGVVPTIRKSSTFDIETELSGTVTDATLDGNAITVDSQDGTTVTLTDSDGSITTSGEYELVLTDNSDPAEDETITVQVNVVGVVPSNNPVQKDGSAQADLTDVEIRVTDGSALDGTQLYYTATATTDASGNLSPIDLSDTSAADGDPVVLTMRTAAGDGLPSDETVGLL